MWRTCLSHPVLHKPAATQASNSTGCTIARLLVAKTFREVRKATLPCQRVYHDSKASPHASNLVPLAPYCNTTPALRPVLSLVLAVPRLVRQCTHRASACKAPHAPSVGRDWNRKPTSGVWKHSSASPKTGSTLLKALGCRSLCSLCIVAWPCRPRTWLLAPCRSSGRHRSRLGNWHLQKLQRAQSTLRAIVRCGIAMPNNRKETGTITLRARNQLLAVCLLHATVYYIA